MPYYNPRDPMDLMSFMATAKRLRFVVQPINGCFFETKAPIEQWLAKNAVGDWRLHLGNESKEFEFVLLVTSSDDLTNFSKVFL